MSWLEALEDRRQRGSSPRCLRLLDGDRQTVAERLMGLVDLAGELQISTSDFWMPLGPPVRNPDDTWNAALAREGKLGENEEFLLSQEERLRLTDWWLAVPRNANTPNWDIASTATIGGKRGFLLVEAKAHDRELKKEEVGKPLKTPVTFNSRRNHVRIGACIQDANLGLTGATKRLWALSRDWNYQMSNRFAWSWKLAEMGYSVVLVYLGFLAANEMRLPSQSPFDSADDWTRLVREHSSAIMSDDIWNRRWTVNGQAFYALIRSTNCPLGPDLAEAKA